MILYRSIASFINKPGSNLIFNTGACFSSAYEKINSPFYMNVQHRPSIHLKFSNEGVDMLIYAYPPLLIKQEQSQNTYIAAGRAMNLTFLETNEEMENNERWQRRKLCPLTFWQSMQLLKIGPKKLNNLELQFISGDQDSNLIFQYFIDYEAEHQRVTFKMEHFKRISQQSKTNIWEINFSLKYIQYRALTQWIRNSIYYSSGMALMVEYSKNEQLLRLQLGNRSY